MLPFIVTEKQGEKWWIFEVTTFFQNFFWVFDFGHFFCPFLKIPIYFWKKMKKTTCEHNALDIEKTSKNIL
jgi:hypothetical protein